MRVLLSDPALLPGSAQGSSIKTSSYTTTATTITTTPITGLSVTVTGQGRYVDVEFVCGAVYHSVAATRVIAHLLVNGASGSNDSQAISVSSPVNNAGVSLILRRTILLTAGSSYTFEIGSYGAAAGTCNFVAVASVPMTLTVTNR